MAVAAAVLPGAVEKALKSVVSKKAPGVAGFPMSDPGQGSVGTAQAPPNGLPVMGRELE